MPTRPQIEATVAQPTFEVQYYTGAVWATLNPTYILSVGTSANATVNEDNPLGFGDSSDLTVDLVCTVDTPLPSWQLLPIRIYLGYEGSNNLYASGVVKERSRDTYSITYTIGGFNEKIKNTTAYSTAFFNRPAATETTVASQENPSLGGYQAGLINYIFWMSGGRPYEQSASYPSALFYYHCDFSLYRVKIAWIAGENIWDELLKIARAAGGQVFQDTLGVMQYKNPLSFALGSAIYTFDESRYQEISEDGTTAQLVGEVRCNYTPRFVAALQQVYEDTTPQLVEASSSITITCETQWPLYSFLLDPSAIQLPGKSPTITASFFTGKPVPNGGSGYSVTVVEESAQRIILNIANNTSTPFVIYKIVLYGEPIISGDQKSFSYSSGEPQRILEDNVYVTTVHHAERLCKMVKDFYGTTRPQRSLTGVVFDPDRYIGEVVLLTNTDWGITDQLHRIVDIQTNDTGTSMDVTLVDVSGLPTTSTFFIVGTTYADADSRQLSY